MKKGDIIYECQSGINIEFEIMTEPEHAIEVWDGKEKNRWTWIGRNTQNDEEISYSLVEGFEHYGPRLYHEPQYCSIGKPIEEGVLNIQFELLGAPE